MATNTSTSSHCTAAAILLGILVVGGAIFNVYVFEVPHNLNSDEDEYLNQVLSILGGEPSGWSIRSFFYPILLSLPVFVLKGLGVSEPVALISAIMTVNWLTLWTALGVTYLIGRRAWDPFTGLLSVVFLLYCWKWVENASRVLFDVPSALWVLLSIYFVLRGLDRDRNVILAVVFACLAVFTKFQAAGAVLGLAPLLLFVPEARGRRGRNLALVLATTVPLLACFGLLDRLVHGQWFGSVINMFDYHKPASMQATGLDCSEWYYYLTHIPWVYSYIFPVFVLVGVAQAATGRGRGWILLCATIPYLISLHFICVKNTRYLITVLPLLTILGAQGLWWSMGVLVKVGKRLTSVADRSWAKTVMDPRLLSAVAAAFLIFTLLPRHEYERLSLTEVCPAFVYGVVQSLDLPESGAVLFVKPCETPIYPIKSALGDRNIEHHNHMMFGEVGRNLKEFNRKLMEAALVFVEAGSQWEALILERGACFERVRESAEGHYAAYVRRPCVQVGEE